MPGIIMGALGGMGEQAANVGSTLLKSELDREARAADRQQDSDLTLQRAKALEEYKAAAVDRDRTAQVERIDTAAGKMAEGEVAKKRGIIESNIADPTAWTPEQQAAVDQSLALDKEAAKADPKIRTQAAIQTGDISPKDAATFGQKDEALMYKTLWEQSKLESTERRAELREDRKDDRQDKALAAQYALLDKRLAQRDKGDGEKANTLQSTQVDGNGYLVGVFRDGTTKRMTDPDGNPVTSQSFEQRVDRVANALVKDGEAKFRKMPPEELRAHVRKTLISGDRGTAAPAAAPPPGPAAAPKPAASAPKPAASARPPLSSFQR